MKVVEKILNWENATAASNCLVLDTAWENPAVFRKIEDEEITAQVEN